MLFLIILIESSTQQKVSTISQQKTYNLPLGKQWWGKNYSCLARNFLFIYHSFQTLHLWMSIYFTVCKVLLMEKKSIAWKTVKDTWHSSLLKKIKSFGKMELWSFLQNGRRQWNKMVKMLFNKVSSKNKKCVFYFSLKIQGNSGQPQINCASLQLFSLPLWCYCCYKLLLCNVFPLM